MNLIKNLALFFSLLIFISCLDEDPKKISSDLNLEVQMAVPLIHSTTTLIDLLPDDENIFFDSDGAIRITYIEEDIAKVDSDKFLTLEDQEPTSESFEIGNIELPEVSDTQIITLEELSQQLTDPVLSSNILNAFNLAQLNNGLAWFPPITSQSGGIYNQNISDQFINVDIVSGTLSLDVTNNFGVPIDFLRIQLKNQFANDFLGDISYSNILPGESFTQFINLDNQTLYSDISFEVAEIYIVGSGLNSNPFDSNVFKPISIEDNITIDIYADGFEVNNGIVIIPEIENGPTDSFSFSFELDDGIELQEIQLSSGLIQYEYESTINADLNLTISIPELIEPGGESYSKEINIENTGMSSTIVIDNLSEYKFDFSSNNNFITVIYETQVNSSENFTSYDFTDSILLSIGINDLEFSSVTGYFGQQIEYIEQDVLNIDVSVLEDIASGIQLESPSLRFFVDNSIGIPFEIDLNLSGTNSAEEVSLNGPSINVPANDFTVAEFNNSNSQLSQLIALSPSVISYSGDVTTNPDNNSSSLNSIFPGTEISIGFEMDLPLHLRIEDAVSEDTLGLNFSENNPENQGLEIESMKFKLRTENDFPLDVNLTILFSDSLTGFVLDSINLDILEAAAVDEMGRTISPNVYERLIQMDEDQIDALFNANQVLLNIQMNSFDNQNLAIRLYTDYEFIIDAGVITEFKIE